MVKVSIRVQSAAASFDVAVLAESAQQVLGLLRSRYPNGDFRVRSLTGLAGFSMDDTAALTDGFLRPDALVA